MCFVTSEPQAQTSSCPSRLLLRPNLPGFRLVIFLWLGMLQDRHGQAGGSWC